MRKCFRRLVSVAMVVLLVLGMGTLGMSSANAPIVVMIEDQIVAFEDQNPVVVDGRTLVPVRGVFEALGFDVNWNPATSQVTLTGSGDVIVLTIGSDVFTTNGVSNTLDVAAQTIEGRTMLPLRLVLESVGMNLQWDAGTSTVLISGGAPGAVVRPLPQPVPQTPPAQLYGLPETIPGTITMADGGVMRFELYPHVAPQSVFNFIYLARQGFYDGLVFHRIISGFMIQGGCPLGIGVGGPGYSIFGEFSDNGFENNLSHSRGVLSMARAAYHNSAGSQFFIMHVDVPYLDGAYATFGLVTEGLEIVDQIAATPNAGPNGYVAEANRPVIASITIDSDIVVPEPNKLTR